MAKMTTDSGENIGGRQISAANNMLTGAVVTGIIFGALFLVYPELDRAIVNPFYAGDNIFRFSQFALTNLARDAFQALFVVASVAAVVGIILGRHRNFSLFGP